MKKTLFVALVALMTAITAMAADNNPVNMTITLKNGLVITYKAADMDSVRYVGGKFRDDGAIGMKIYLNGSTQSVDYLYSQIDDVTYTVVTTTTFTRVTSSDQLETGKRYIIVCESMNGAMGGAYNNTFRALVTSGITLANGTATVEDNSNVVAFELGGTTGNYTLKVGNDYLSNPTSTTHLTTVSTLGNTEKWAITFDNNNASIKNKGTYKFIYYFQDGGYFEAFTTGTPVQLYVEGTVTPTDNNANRNSLSSYYDANKYMYNLEWPHIRENSSQSWTTKTTSSYGDGNVYVNYSLEWDNSKIANRFTCYQMNSRNSASIITDRANSFREDEELPEATRSTLEDYKNSGFSRGHLCPSADRRATADEEDQTYFLSNMQPQYQSHNGAQWSNLENDVRTIAESATCDTLYVVKAATIEDVLLDGNTQTGLRSEMCNNRLIVPKYFYMALLAYNKSSNTYQAMGIWTYHYYATSEKQNAQYITIDELEQRTGIDFFCNLPDDIEESVESTLTTTYWTGCGINLNR